ncbi:thioredoxin-like 4, chloroplastic [Rosa sericea]
MYRQNVLYSKAEASFNFGSQPIIQSRYQIPISFPERTHVRLCPSIRITGWEVSMFSHGFRAIKKIRVADENQGELSDEDDDLCPVECVREFYTDEEFFKILDTAKKSNSLVVVDFYRTSCGSCKYIEQGFSKLCKRAGEGEAEVIFLKHNVIDEYDEQSEVADRLRIKTVPLFHFYKDGVLLEAFPTRDKERITAAIRKYTSPETSELI